MSAINKPMDPKTKQLVERAEALLLSEDDADRPDDEFIKALCSAVREQDKRARHAEAERDTFSKRIDELEAQRHEIIQACLGRDVKDALASQVLGLWKSQSKLTEYAAELEAQLREAVPYVLDYFWDKYEMNDRLAKLTSDSSSPKQTPESQRRKASQGIDLALSFCLLRRSKLSAG